jgi:UDP-N-acetylglucosamine acyltransferase
MLAGRAGVVKPLQRMQRKCSTIAEPRALDRLDKPARPDSSQPGLSRDTETELPIHATAIIDPSAQIDPSATIGPYAVIEGPVQIGADTTILAYVHVLGHTTIGRGCRIHSGAVLGDWPQDRAYAGAESYCRIGDETVIREHVTVHRGTAPGSETVIGNRCLLLAHSHVAHNCRLDDDILLVNGALLAGYVTVGPRAVISGNAAVHQFARIGELAMIGGLAKITRDVPPFLMFDGAGLCVGVNVVGLRRAGYTREERQEVKAIYKTLYRTAGSLSRALSEISAAMVSTPAGRVLYDFLQAPSKRGIQAGTRDVDVEDERAPPV